MDKNRMLAAVAKSPAAVAAQDREAWLGLFAQFAVIEDPVGSTPHISGLYDRRSGRRGNGPLQRFYNAFIDGNTIDFITNQDFIVGNTVLRDLALQLQVHGMRATVPMHLLYELVDEGGELKIRRLAAHWEFMAVSRQMLGSNFFGMFAYSAKLFTQIGLSGLIGFSGAAFNVGKRGKTLVRQFVQANNAGQLTQLEALFDRLAEGVDCGDSAGFVAPRGLLDQQWRLSADKLIAAGNRVSCSLQIDHKGDVKAGAAIFDFNRRSSKLQGVRLFVQQ